MAQVSFASQVVDSSGDEFNSVTQSPHGPMTKHAGATPMNFGKCKVEKNAIPAYSRHRLPSVKLSRVVSGPRMDRIVKSTRKQKCLFNTMHVKTALALMTVFYLLGLAFLDQFLFGQELSEVVYLLFGLGSIIAVGTTLTAQYALFRENCWMILPFFVVQASFTALLCVAYAHQVIVQLIFAKLHPRVAMRLVLLVTHETILTCMQGYALMITFRCINYLYEKKRNQSSGHISCSNFKSFVDEAVANKNRTVNLQIVVDESQNASTQKEPVYAREQQSPVAKQVAAWNDLFDESLVKPLNYNSQGPIMKEGNNDKRRVSFVSPTFKDVTF